MSSISAIPIICGPTGSGKTGLAVRLAGQYPIDIVSADSRQIIRHLDIGTAKPTAGEQSAAPCHLIDIIDPGDNYSAWQFVTDAVAAIEEILSRDRLPVVVGGTGMYLKALTHGLAETPDSDPDIRERLADDMERLGPYAMWQRLHHIDPAAAAAVHPNNKVRVIRALEIYELSGQTKSHLSETLTYPKHDISFEYYCLLPDRAVLYDQINRRVERMMAGGLLEEVKALLSNGWAERLARANVIGYNELLAAIAGKMSMDDATALIQRNHRRLAKRQFTWFRHQIIGRYFSDPDTAFSALAGHLAAFRPKGTKMP